MKYKLTKWMAIAALGLGLLGLGTAKAQFINVGGTPTFIKGANLPWLDGHFSYYLALDPHNPSYGCAFNYNTMNQHFADMHNMGINVVRLWVHTNDQGCTIDSNGNTTGVTSLFWTNMDNTVYLAGLNGIHLYVTLNGGRADFLTDGTKLNMYINNALKPMIKRYQGDNRIFAIDAMNEIDGVVGGPDGNYGSGPSWAQAQSYIRSIVSAVHSVDGSRLVSCSTGWHAWNNLGYFKGQGLDFYDFHLYNDNGYIPAASTLGLDKPVYVGETGQSTNSWSDSIQNTEMSNMLNNAKNGYAGVGIWAYNYAGSTDKFTMINANGSWRPVCYTIQSFSFGGGGGGGGGSGPVAAGTYQLINRVNGKALDNLGSTADGANVGQWAAGASNNQRWVLSYVSGSNAKLTCVTGGKSLDSLGHTTDGSTVGQWTSGGSANQQWTLQAQGGGWYKLINNGNGKALDTGGSTTDGAAMQFWYSNTSFNQQWQFK
jgi:hypothetical protein